MCARHQHGTRQGARHFAGYVGKTSWRSTRELSVRSAFFFPAGRSKILMEKALGSGPPSCSRPAGKQRTLARPSCWLAKKRHVPMLILNGRMTDKSLRGYLKLEAAIPGFWEYSIAPSMFGAISKADAGRFARIFGADDRVEACRTSNCRPGHRHSHTRAVSDPLLKPLPPELHARQTRPAGLRPRTGRTRAPFRFIQTLHRARRPTIVIAPPGHAPRQTVAGAPERRETPGRHALEARRDHPRRVHLHLMGDTFWWNSASFYQLADAVFVGGSLAPSACAQNFLEPLALGRIPCCGPHLDNFCMGAGTNLPAKPGARLARNITLGLLHIYNREKRRQGRIR